MGRKTKLGCWLLIVLWTVSPILSVLIAGAVASGYGCQLDEGGVHPCVVLGTDVGELLNTMFVAGWFFFFTIPSGLVLAVVFLIVVLITNRKKHTEGTA